MSYDGHQGADAGVLMWDEMAVGVPVYAAVDGTVVIAHDGFNDMNVCNGADDGNYIIIDNGGGWQTWYFHLRKGSVAVAPGQIVAAGQQIGFMGSSGYSCGPHLHFQTMFNGNVVEPFSGACNPAASMWAAQPPVNALSVGDMAFLQNPPSFYLPVQTIPRDGEILMTGVGAIFWARLLNLPANSTFHLRYYAPDDSLAYDEPTYPFNNTTQYGDSWYWFWRDFWQLHSIAGIYRLKFDVNGATVIDAPFSVVAGASGVNHAPNAIDLAMAPASPGAADSVGCRIASSQLFRDPDYDMLSYHYIWAVNGNIVRNVTTASRSDRVARGTAAPGQILTCFVTPNDGALDGPPSAKSAIVAGSPNIYDSASWSNSGLLTNVGAVSLSSGVAHFAAGNGPAGQPFTIGVAGDTPAEYPINLFYGGNPGSFVIDVVHGRFLYRSGVVVRRRRIEFARHRDSKQSVARRQVVPAPVAFVYKYSGRVFLYLIERPARDGSAVVAP